MKHRSTFLVGPVSVFVVFGFSACGSEPITDQSTEAVKPHCPPKKPKKPKPECDAGRDSGDSDSGESEGGYVDAGPGSDAGDPDGATSDGGSTNCYDTGCPSQHVCKEQPGTPGFGSCLFVPDPPVHCMAPCLWEARKNCLPVMRNCVRSATYYPNLGGAVCDLDTGWRQAFMAGPGSFDTTTDYHNNVKCFGTAYPTPGSGIWFSGPAGNVGVTLDGVTYCDDLEFFQLPDPSAPQYPSTPSAPECV